MKTKKRGLLVFQFSTLANSAMSVPILRALFDAQPDLEITWVTQPDAVPLFSEFDNIKLIEVDLNGIHQGWKGMYRLFQGLRQASRYRVIADLQGSQTTLFFRRFIPSHWVSIGTGQLGLSRKSASYPQQE